MKSSAALDIKSRSVGQSVSEIPKKIPVVCPCGCGATMDRSTGLFFPIRGFPMGYRASGSHKQTRGARAKLGS
jgi:hypothetical protein